MTEQDQAGLAWRKSSRSGPNNNCVELAPAHGRVAIRDSKNPNGGRLQFNTVQWDTFARATKQAHFDRA